MKMEMAEWKLNLINKVFTTVDSFEVGVYTAVESRERHRKLMGLFPAGSRQNHRTSLVHRRPGKRTSHRGTQPTNLSIPS